MTGVGWMVLREKVQWRTPCGGKPQAGAWDRAMRQDQCVRCAMSAVAGK